MAAVRLPSHLVPVSTSSRNFDLGLLWSTLSSVMVAANVGLEFRDIVVIFVVAFVLFLVVTWSKSHPAQPPLHCKPSTMLKACVQFPCAQFSYLLVQSRSYDLFFPVGCFLKNPPCERARVSGRNRKNILDGSLRNLSPSCSCVHGQWPCTVLHEGDGES
ncbi:hypothetical protein BDV96DRAFT_42081 [Lophiotrema nucula]|uniref:Uncharacterized protein n=1 Tax=Lophiotrema nucula TaxID=690887 RepID=A0A6A5ZCH0_9PLEO|nr:hypothetical protein BDV96DRAFT_42081 [Lophiotrema nucula]